MNLYEHTYYCLIIYLDLVHFNYILPFLDLSLPPYYIYTSHFVRLFMVISWLFQSYLMMIMIILRSIVTYFILFLISLSAGKWHPSSSPITFFQDFPLKLFIFVYVYLYFYYLSWFILSELSTYVLFCLLFTCFLILLEAYSAS